MLRATTFLAVLLVSCAAPPPPAPVEPKVEPTKDKRLDCAFARNVENCWRTVNNKLLACLGGKPSAPGKLQKSDASMCVLGDQVAVKLGEACDPDATCVVRELFVGKGDKKCGEIHATVERPPSEEGRGAGSLEVTIADGTVKLEYDEKTKKVTCPDGSVFVGSGDWKGELADCADDSGYQGMPGWSTTVTPSRKEGKKKLPARLSIELGSEPFLECEKP